MVGGALGGMTGPANMYHTLAQKFRQIGVHALQLKYRRPKYLKECVEDVCDTIKWLGAYHQVSYVLLVGWSFGGAVAISAGVSSEKVVGVATVGSQTSGTELVGKLAKESKSLLLMHGTGDTVLSYTCSKDLYKRAGKPKELVLYDNDSHGLDMNGVKAMEKIFEWGTKTLIKHGCTIVDP